MLDAQTGRLTMVRWVFADNQPTRVQVVAYRVRDGVLTRRESLATRDLKELDASWSAVLGDSDAAQPVVLQAGVNRLAIRTWINDGAGWRSSSDVTQGLSGSASGGTGGSATQTIQTAPVTGLEVSLQLQGRDTDLVKVFLLGAV
jgi:general secretion pathway protein J